MARIKSSYKTNADFERLGFKLNDIEQAMLGMSNDMSALTGNALTQPEPSIPFKLAEEPDVDGIFPTLAIKVPQQTEVVRVQLIRRSDNIKLSTDASDEAAIARARRRIFSFRFEVSEDEAANGVVERRTDKPIKRRKATSKNQLQLIRLIALNDKDAFAKSPSDDPFKPTTPINVGDPIFPALVVRDKYDSLDSGHMPDETIMMDWDKRYFNIGTSVAGPSKPALDKIVSNAINLETPQTGDVKVTFKVEANANNNGSASDVSFETAGYNEATVILQRINPDGSTDPGGVLSFPLAIEDTDQTFVLIDAILPLGARFKWRRNVVGNGVKKEAAVPDMDVTFFAGGIPPTAGIPELQAFTIAVGETDGQFTEVAVQIQQKASPNLPALLKRIQFFKTNPGGTKKFAGKIPLLDEETVFIAGKTSTFFFQIKHKKNLTGIRFDATVIGINHTEAVPIQRDASPFMGNSIFAGKPTQPSLSLVTTAPDTDSDEANDSFADFTVGASATDPTATFASVGTDTIFIALRKLNGLADDDPDDNRIVKYPFPIEDLNVTQVICRVRNLKTGRRYRWPRNIASNSGAIIKSDPVGTPVEFRAGQMTIDLTTVGISITSITQEDGNFVVRVRITQAAAPTMPAILRAVSLFKDRNNGQGFVEIANSKVRIKDKPEFQVAGAAVNLDIEINALKNTTAQLRARVVAVGGAIKDSVAVPAVAIGGQPPTTLPSVPQASDIIINTVQADVSTGKAVVTFSVFASWMRAMTGQGGTGPGGSINFNDVSADEAAVVIADAATSGQGQEFKAADFDPTQNSADVTVELTIGKAYLYRRNITFRAGIPAKSTIANITFTAGGRAGVDGFPGLTFTLQPLGQVLTGTGQVDNTQVEAILSITQPNPAYLLKAFEIERKRGAESTYKLIIPRERIFDDITYQTPGVKPNISRIIPIPRNGAFDVRARLIGLGDGVGGGSIKLLSNVRSSTMPGDGGPTDPGRPQYSGQRTDGQINSSPFLVPRLIVKWKKSGINVRCNLPDINMITHKTCYVSFRFDTRPFSASVVRYFYNPDSGDVFQGPSLVFPDPVFHLDIGKTLKATFTDERPLITGSIPSVSYTNQGGGFAGDLPDQIANALLQTHNASRQSELVVSLITVNRFDPAFEFNSAVTVTSTGSLVFPFDPKLNQFANSWTVS